MRHKDLPANVSFCFVLICGNTARPFVASVSTNITKLETSHRKTPYEPRREKTNVLHVRKQRRRSASR